MRDKTVIFHGSRGHFNLLRDNPIEIILGLDFVHLALVKNLIVLVLEENREVSAPELMRVKSRASELPDSVSRHFGQNGFFLVEQHEIMERAVNLIVKVDFLDFLNSAVDYLNAPCELVFADDVVKKRFFEVINFPALRADILVVNHGAVNFHERACLVLGDCADNRADVVVDNRVLPKLRQKAKFNRRNFDNRGVIFLIITYVSVVDFGERCDVLNADCAAFFLLPEEDVRYREVPQKVDEKHIDFLVVKRHQQKHKHHQHAYRNPPSVRNIRGNQRNANKRAEKPHKHVNYGNALEKFGFNLGFLWNYSHR